MKNQFIQSLKNLISAHCSSDGHDGRYYTKEETNNIIKNPGGGVNYIGNNNYIVYPKDAQFIATNTYGATQGDITGCLRITLPVSWDNSMLSFVVSIYNYLPNTSVIYYISGYNYTGMVPDDARWHSCTAICIGKIENPLANLPVKFAHNGEKCVVEIGSPSTVWRYPQVQIHDILIGFHTARLSDWISNWKIEFISSEIDNISCMIENTHITLNGIYH